MVDDSKCPICRSPIKSSTDGSLTQWILSCHCYDAHVAESQTLSARICTTCAKPMKQGLPGSFTQFLFQSEFCSCSAPPEVRAAMAAGAFAPQPAFQERDEEELAIAENEFPVDRYKPLKMLGAGRFGSVYLARDRLLDKVVAVKTLNALSARELVAFQQEAKTLSKLQHESIVRVLDFGTVNAEVPYMVLDYVRGETLRNVLDRDGPMPWETALDVFGRICGGFDYAHKNGILHRDLNPQNVLLIDRSKLSTADRGENDSPYDVRIIDFGIADLVNLKIDADKSSKPEESLVGTPVYMSPEAGNGRPYEVRSEVYSVGCMLFEALCGRPPFLGNSPMETLTMHALEPPPDLSEATDSYIPPAVKQIVEKALAKTPEGRFSTMSDFKSALENAAGKAGFGVNSDSNETTDVNHLSDVNHERNLTASYPVSLLIGVTVLAIVGFCFVAYSFAVQEQPLSQRLTGKAPTQNSTQETTGTKAEKSNLDLDKTEAALKNVEEKVLDDGLGKGWSRNPKSPAEVLGFDVTDDDFKELDAEPTFNRLTIQSASVGAKGIDYMAALPSLGHLLFRYSTLPNHTFSTLARSKSLYILDVTYSHPIDPEDLKGLARSPKLNTLKMSHTDIGDKHAAALEKTRLISLQVDHTKLSDAALMSLAKIKTLKELTIKPIEGITPEGLKRFVKMRPDCQILRDND